MNEVYTVVHSGIEFSDRVEMILRLDGVGGSQPHVGLFVQGEATGSEEIALTAQDCWAIVGVLSDMAHDLEGPAGAAPEVAR